MVDPAPEFARQRQELQLVAAKTKLGALAWQIAETPWCLLDYLAPYIPDSLPETLPKPPLPLPWAHNQTTPCAPCHAADTSHFSANH